MSADPIPLPIFPWPMSPEREALVREAYNATGTHVSIIPCPAVPESPGRVLAFGQIPDFVCETVLIRAENVDNVDSIRRALDFTLHTPMVPGGTPGTFTHAMWLSAVMGCEVKFLYEESLVKEEPKPETLRFY